MPFLPVLLGILMPLVVLSDELLVALTSGGHLALSTSGASSLRARFLEKHDFGPIVTPMVEPTASDAAFHKVSTAQGNGIQSSFGSLVVSSKGELVLVHSNGTVLTKSAPLGVNHTDPCQAMPNTDVGSCTRVADPMTVKTQHDCCDACTKNTECTNWIYGLGDPAGNCWLVKDPQGFHANPSRTLGGAGLGSSLSFSTRSSGLYGRGGGSGDGTQLTAASVTPFVDNKQTYVPHMYSSEDGYGCLAVVNQTTGSGKTNYFNAGYSTDGAHITWTYDPEQPFELYFMPAGRIDDGTSALYALTGAAAVPPRYAFGFLASRWGWENRSYIESVLHHFRSGSYPIDAIITDFGWFTNVSDYDFPSQGFSWYDDFGFAKATFPQPQQQLSEYHSAPLQFHMGGIRKPRLGNTELLQLAGAKGWLLPGGEMEYAELRNLDFGNPEAREWYAEQQQHYLTDGVDFFWNDEGETDYFTFHWWNVAQLQSLRKVSADRRFFSINRAFTPGMARLGAATWTGDINPTWDDLANTPGMVLNWGLAGAPYTACDIGGFTGESEAHLLTRWMQLGTFMPVMRVHSTKSATPHFPWLWGDPYAGIMRAALDLRYRLIPYHYSLAHQMHSTGKLWMRPMAAEFPGDETAAPLTSQYMDGDMLVAPVLSEDSTKHVYLPEGTWYAFNGSSTTTGPQSLKITAALTEVPVFVRAGTVLPLAPVVQFSNALPGGSLQVQVYAGADGSFDLFEDDGNSTAYQAGAVTITSLKWADASKTLSWSVSGAGKAANAFEQLFVTMFDASGQSSSAVKAIGTSGSIQMS